MRHVVRVVASPQGGYDVYRVGIGGMRLVGRGVAADAGPTISQGEGVARYARNGRLRLEEVFEK